MRYELITCLEKFTYAYDKFMQDEASGPLMLHVKMEQDQELKPRLASFTTSSGSRVNYPLDNMYPHGNRHFEGL